VKYAFIQEHRHLFPIIRMCQVLGVSENGYYNWRKRGKSQRKRDDDDIAERIEDAYDANRGVYGSPRIHAELKAQGIHCGRKRIVRLMQEKNISARRKRRKARTTNSNHSSPIAPNLLERDFAADAPNKKWVTDITYIATYEGWLYLAGILDTYSRKIIGWAMGKQHDAELVRDALHMALIQRQPAADLVHHSDRGGEYASIRYQELLHQHNIQISMSRKGDCYDNSMMESFWGKLKEEGIGEAIFSSRKEAETTLFDYIEVFYNRKRRHSSLGYLSPVDFEKQGEKREDSLLTKR
jgi:transposase InsO family protein